jgi:hypothetical protein
MSDRCKCCGRLIYSQIVSYHYNLGARYTWLHHGSDRRQCWINPTDEDVATPMTEEDVIDRVLSKYKSHVPE